MSALFSGGQIPGALASVAPLQGSSADRDTLHKGLAVSRSLGRAHRYYLHRSEGHVSGITVNVEGPQLGRLRDLRRSDRQ